MITAVSCYLHLRELLHSAQLEPALLQVEGKAEFTAKCSTGLAVEITRRFTKYGRTAAHAYKGLRYNSGTIVL